MNLTGAIPKISVIMPVRDTEMFLEEAVASILSQSFRDLELIIIDDHSSDASRAIAESFAKKDQRVSLLRNDKVLGVSASKNRGLAAARGEYAAIMDADDVSFPDRLALEYAYLQSHPDIYLVGGSFEYISEEEEVINVHPVDFGDTQTKRVIEKEYVIRQSSIMFRNTKEFSYDERLKVSEDKDLYLRLIKAGKHMVVLPNLLVRYRVHKDSLSSNHMNLQKRLNESISRHYKTGQELRISGEEKEADPESVSEQRKIWAAYGEKRSNRRYLFRQVMHAKGKFKLLNLMYLCASFLPKRLVSALKSRIARLRRP